MDISVSQHLHPHRSTPHLWLGMILQAKKDHAAALASYNRSKALSLSYDWQATYRDATPLQIAPGFALGTATPRAAQCHDGFNQRR